MQILTPRGIYNKLYREYYRTYYGHFADTYKGQNAHERFSNKYAIKNTLRVWKEQYEKPNS